MNKMSNNLAMNDHNISDLFKSLSQSRMTTFLHYHGLPHCPFSALDLYAWNAQISANLILPMHICEVIIRNAVNEAIVDVYGHLWAWNSTFIGSLPNPKYGFNPRQELEKRAKKHQTINKIIPELKFVWWQKMFASRYLDRIWHHQIATIFPHYQQSPKELLIEIYDDLENIRRVRNRIAHHEHLLNKDLEQIYHRILKIISYRSVETGKWLESIQQIKPLLMSKPKRRNI